MYIRRSNVSVSARSGCHTSVPITIDVPFASVLYRTDAHFTSDAKGLAVGIGSAQNHRLFASSGDASVMGPTLFRFQVRFNPTQIFLFSVVFPTKEKGGLDQVDIKR